MGRTIHYTIKGTQAPTEQTTKEIHEIIEEFNSKYTWTCEDIEYLHGDSGNYGFTKVAGNEWNALLVISCLTLVSKKIPKNRIYVRDEGYFLKAPIIIQNGKARVDVKYVRDSIQSYKKRIKEYEAESVLDARNWDRKIDYWQWMKEENTRLQTARKNNVDRVNVWIKEQEEILKLKTTKFVDIGTFTQQVSKEDFSEHPEFQTTVIGPDSGSMNGTPNQVMAGFHGEYYGKVSQAEVAMESNKFIPFITILAKLIESSEITKIKV